jgi:hypothetical protein
MFQLLWSDTVEQIKQHSPYFSGDPERPEFERAVEELERVLQEGMVHSEKQPVSIATLSDQSSRRQWRELERVLQEGMVRSKKQPADCVLRKVTAHCS